MDATFARRSRFGCRQVRVPSVQRAEAQPRLPAQRRRYVMMRCASYFYIIYKHHACVMVLALYNVSNEVKERTSEGGRSDVAIIHFRCHVAFDADYIT